MYMYGEKGTNTNKFYNIVNKMYVYICKFY